MDQNKERSVKQINVSLEIGLKGNTGMIDILEAARYLVYLSYQEDRHSLTPLKLQKILYLAQGWSFVWDSKALFPENFCAWEYGPANEKVYETFKKYGRSEISAAEGIPDIADKDARDTLEAVWGEYGKRTAYDLVDLTCSQAPWRDASADNTKITNACICAYFKSTFLS